MKVLPMFVISMLAALLSSMSFWADKWSDVRLSLNDFYMAFLMTGWMFFLEGAWMFHWSFFVGGAALIVASLVFIRTQAFVDIQQYVRGMIPHHSMAVFMSKKLMEKYGESVLGTLPREIVKSQESEIVYLKNQEVK